MAASGGRLRKQEARFREECVKYQRAVAQILRDRTKRSGHSGSSKNMMGRQQTQHELWAPTPDLFSRIPEDHLLRRLERVLDLSFVRGEVARCYGANGNASVDPVVLMKMMLLLFLDDVPSERELMRIIPLRLDYLWFFWLRASGQDSRP